MPTMQTQVYQSPFFRKLSDNQVERIHLASLEILDRTGVRLYSEEALNLVKQAGLAITDDNLVRFPPHLIEWALNIASSKITLCDRDGNRVMPLESYNVFYGPGSDCPNVIDLETGERRPALLSDVSDGVRLCDALPNIDFVMSFCVASDVDQQIADRYQMKEILTQSTKPSIFVTTGFEGTVDAVEMAAVVAGGMDALRRNPLTACYINVTGPLRHNEDSLQKLLYLSEQNIPFSYIPVVLRGLNGPITPAGALALANAGELVGVVLSQLKREGAPIIISGGTNDLVDMRTMVGSYAAPENRVMFMEVAHHYNLPMFGLGGGSDSKRPDSQAAAEAALTLLTETLSGANIIHDVGYLESGMSASYEQMVICNELIGWIKRFVQGLEISDETLALDLIDQVGLDGSFINTDHTTAHFREDWYPTLFDRQNYEAWALSGGEDLHERAVKRTKRILDEYTPEPLPEDMIAALDKVIEKAS